MGQQLLQRERLLMLHRLWRRSWKGCWQIRSGLCLACSRPYSWLYFLLRHCPLLLLCKGHSYCYSATIGDGPTSDGSTGHGSSTDDSARRGSSADGRDGSTDCSSTDGQVINLPPSTKEHQYTCS